MDSSKHDLSWDWTFHIPITSVGAESTQHCKRRVQHLLMYGEMLMLDFGGDMEGKCSMCFENAVS